MSSLLMHVDSYKNSHYQQYRDGTEYISSYIEARSDKSYPYALFFGLQTILPKLKCPTIAEVIQANEILTSHGIEFNLKGWVEIAALGYLPIRIQAVKEGTIVPNHNVLIQVINTDPRFPWLTSFIETMLLRIWYPITVATRSKFIKNILLDSLIETGDPSLINFKLHDFGFRGVSSEESGCIGGTAHLVNFMGTDTLGALVTAREVYGETMAGYSIPAAEHSTITSWGANDSFLGAEVAAYDNMLTKFLKPGKMVAVVSDSYDLMYAVKEIWGKRFKERIIASGGTLVIRPDCYDDRTEVLTYEGWKLFSDVTSDTLIGQVGNDLTLSFVKPSKIVNEKYSGDMVAFTDQKGRVDLLVTPNHRMVVLNNDKITTELAKDVSFYYNKNIPRTVYSNSGENITPYERFLIAFQADGSFPSGFDKIETNICGHISARFNFQKQRKINRLIKICEMANLYFTISEEPSRGKKLKQKTIYVRVPVDKPLSKRFDWFNPNEKGYEWGRSFISEILQWDGSIRDSGRGKYDTTDEFNADVVQLVATKSGYGCTFGKYTDNRSVKFSDVFSLSITNKTVIGGQSIKKETVTYNGTIHCVTVPSGMLLVRRNKRIVVCGNSGDPTMVPLEVIEQLGRDFGYTVNDKGYKVLPSCVRVIQGDGVNENSIRTCLENINVEGWSTDNITFGMGGELLQTVNRDTLGFAMKANAGKDKTGFWYDIYKNPKTDPSKASKKGRLALIKTDEGFKTELEVNVPKERNLLDDVFVNGKILRYQTLAEIRAISNQ